LKLLLEVTTVRSLDDPRAGHLTENLAHAQDELATAAGRITDLFTASRDVASLITGQLPYRPGPGVRQATR
jgi:hypothetical protein